MGLDRVALPHIYTDVRYDEIEMSTTTVPASTVDYFRGMDKRYSKPNKKHSAMLSNLHTSIQLSHGLPHAPPSPLLIMEKQFK